MSPKYDFIAEYYHCISFLVGFLKFALPGVNYCLFSFASFIMCLPIIPLLILQRTVKFSQCGQTHQEINQFDFFSWKHLFWSLCPLAVIWAAFSLALMNTCHLGNCLHLFSVLYYSVSFNHIVSFLVFSFGYSIYSIFFSRKGASKVHFLSL